LRIRRSTVPVPVQASYVVLTDVENNTPEDIREDVPLTLALGLASELAGTQGKTVPPKLQLEAVMPTLELIRFPGHLPEPVSSRSPEHGEAPKAVHGRV
jgi:hypothetical protein